MITIMLLYDRDGLIITVAVHVENSNST